MKVYDNYEISPCRRFEKPDTPGKVYFEVCEPGEADVWTLYGHIDGEGVEAIGDFPTQQSAEETYSRITGLPFTGSYQAEARLRVMHAWQKLLEAATLALRQLREFYLDHDSQAILDLKAAIAQAGDEPTTEPQKPIVIEVRGGVVQDVLNVPPGYAYDIRDYDHIEAEREVAADKPGADSGHTPPFDTPAGSVLLSPMQVTQMLDNVSNELLLEHLRRIQADIAELKQVRPEIRDGFASVRQHLATHHNAHTLLQSAQKHE